MPDQDYRDLAKHFISKTCVPLAIERDDQSSAILQGSGTFFNFDGLLFFVTASHVFDDVDMNKIGIPISSEGKDIIKIVSESNGKMVPIVDCTVLTFGRFKLYKESQSDVAIVHLMDEDVVAKFHGTYDFLDYSYLANPTGNGNVIVAGHSLYLGKKAADAFIFPCLTYETILIAPPPDEKYLENIDCFLPYYDLEEVGGGEVEPFMLNGLSGGPIWQVMQLPREQLWSPRFAMKFIGIEKSVKLNRFIRGTFAKHLATLFERIDSSIAAKIKSALEN